MTHLSERAGEEVLGGIRECPQEPWQDIATAPKDREILVSGCSYGPPVRTARWGSGRYLGRKKGYEQGWADYPGRTCDPTHWMPLPPPVGSGRSLADAPKESPSLSEAREEIERLRKLAYDDEGNTYREKWQISHKNVGRVCGVANRYRDKLDGAREALSECEEYFDNRADADCDQDGFIPNKEMRLLSVVRTTLQALENGKANLADANNSNDTRLLRERVRELEEALQPLADRINEIEQVKAVAKFATEGTAAVSLSLLRRARSVLAQGVE